MLSLLGFPILMVFGQVRLALLAALLLPLSFLTFKMAERREREERTVESKGNYLDEDSKPSA